jgi:hypothetical protein
MAWQGKARNPLVLTCRGGFLFGDRVIAVAAAVNCTRGHPIPRSEHYPLLICQLVHSKYRRQSRGIAHFQYIMPQHANNSALPVIAGSPIPWPPIHPEPAKPLPAAPVSGCGSGIHARLSGVCRLQIYNHEEPATAAAGFDLDHDSYTELYIVLTLKLIGI